MLFNRDRILSSAGRNLAPGLPATAGERAAIDFDVFVDQRQFLSDLNALRGAYTRIIGDIEGATGERLANPFDLSPEGGIRENDAARERTFFRQVEALRERFPGLPVETPDTVRERIAGERATQRGQQADVQARSIDVSTALAGFAAEAGGALSDPFVALTLPFGASASAGVLRFALTEAGIAGLTEAGIQTRVQLARQQFGEEPSFSEGLSAVLTASAGGFLLGGVLRGAPPTVRATRRLLDSVRGIERPAPAVQDAAEYLARRLDEQKTNPFAQSGPRLDDHHANQAEALSALRNGRASPADVRGGPARRDLLGSTAIPQDVVDVAPQIRTALEIGNALHNAAAERVAERAARQVIVDTVPERLRTPEAIQELRQELQRPIKNLQGLLGFLRQSGGVRDEAGELAALGLTSRTLPGLLRKQGRNLDDAALAAQEAGFFPGRNLDRGDRITPNDLLDAIDQELRGQPVVREADRAVQAEQLARQEMQAALERAGVDLDAPDEDIARAIRGMELEEARFQEQAKLSQAGAAGDDIEERVALMAEEDALLFQELEARADSDQIILQDADGNARTVTAAELRRELQQADDDLAALQACGVG